MSSNLRLAVLLGFAVLEPKLQTRTSGEGLETEKKRLHSFPKVATQVT